MNDAAKRRQIVPNSAQHGLGLFDVGEVAGALMDRGSQRSDVTQDRLVGFGTQPRRLSSTRWRAPARASTRAISNPQPGGAAGDQIGRVRTNDAALRIADFGRREVPVNA